MPVSTIVATAGSANANAYCTVAAADQYHLDRPADTAGTWAAASTDQKTAAILWATKLLDSTYEWEGFVATATQSLLWPRSGLLYQSGYAVPVTVIPVPLRDACAEFARQLLVADRTADSDIETQGLTALSAGAVSLTFKDSVQPKVVPDAVANLIPASWGVCRGRAASVRQLVRA